MVENEREVVMGLVSREWLYRQTMAEGHSNHWMELVEQVLALSNSSKAILKKEGFFYPSEAVRLVLRVPPRDLEALLAARQ